MVSKKRNPCNRMGAFSSKGPGQAITRQQLLEKSTNNRAFVNTLFQVLLKQVTPEDYLKLANPTQCSQFVFLLADSIRSMFHDLRIHPKQDKRSGVVFFEKFETLKKNPINRELCLSIAYFYIRIFQIFGALALSILDDPSAGGTIGAMRYGAQPVGAIQGPAMGPRKVPGSRPAYFAFGGAIPDDFRTASSAAFKSLYNILESPVQDRYRRLVFRFIEKPDITLVPDRRQDGTTGPSQNLRIEFPDGSHLYGNMTLAPITPKTSAERIKRVTLGNFKYTKNIPANQLNEINRQLKGYTPPAFDIASVDNELSWYVGSDTFAEKLDLVLQTMKSTILDELETHPDLTLKDVLPKRQLKQYLQPKQVRYEDGRVVGQAAQQRVGAQYGVRESVGVPKALQNEYMIQILKGLSGTKQTGFCIARALQLLDANALSQRNPATATSGVCLPKFDALPLSVPQSGSPISSVPGIRAMEQLYHVDPKLSAKEETIVQVTNPQEYAEFLQTISGLFGRPADASRLTGIDAILARDPNCAGAAAKHYLQIQDPKAVQRVLQFVNQMFGRQFTHTQRVIQFFRTRLFVFTKSQGSTTIDIHPKLLQGGIDELAKVSKEARTLLLQYYSDCEKMYQQGAQVVLSARTAPIQ